MYVMHISNIWKIYIIRVARTALFMMPIITLYFQERGLSMAQIMILQSIFAIAIVVLEVPSGYITDIFERKTIIIWAIILSALGTLFYGFSYDFWSLMFSEIILAIASALGSGTYSAMLYDSLKADGKEKEHTKYASRLFSFQQFSESTASILGGFIAVLSLSYTFFLSAFVIFITLPVALALKEPPREKIDKKANHVKEMLAIIKFAIHKNGKIKWLIIYGSALNTSTLVATWMLQPYFKLLNIPIIYFGTLWAILNLSMGIFALMAHRIENILGLKKALILLAFLPMTAYFILSQFQTVFILPFILLFSATRALSAPIMQDYINREISSKIRATVLSVYGLFGRLLFVILSPFIGYMADIYTLQIAFLSSALIFGLLSFIALPFLFTAYKG